MYALMFSGCSEADSAVAWWQQ